MGYSKVIPCSVMGILNGFDSCKFRASQLMVMIVVVKSPSYNNTQVSVRIGYLLV